MKKLYLWSAALCTAAFLLSACGGSSDEVKRIEKDETTAVSDSAADTSSTDSTAENNDNPASDGYVFTDGGVTVSVDAPMEPVLSKLGEPNEYFEAASCAFEGLDKMYTYSHYEIDTYPSADGDRISAVYLTDDLVTTPEGLSIGSSKEDMERIYGTDYEAVGTEYTYRSGDMSLKIQLSEDKVSYITYASKVLGTVAEN